MAECKQQHCANPSWCKLTNKCLVALFPNANPKPDCRTCKHFDGKVKYSEPCKQDCTNADRYEPLPPVRLWRTT